MPTAVRYRVKQFTNRACPGVAEPGISDRPPRDGADDTDGLRPTAVRACARPAGQWGRRLWF